MQPTQRTMLFIALLVTAVVAQERPQCSDDPCFVQAALPASCCVLDQPAVIALAENKTSTAVVGQALRAYVETVCAAPCSAYLGSYRQCLNSAPIDQQLVEDYLPENLCNLTCLIDNGVDFDTMDNCNQLASVTGNCKNASTAIQGVIGEAMSEYFNRCSRANGPTGQPLVRAAAGPTPPSRPPLPAPGSPSSPTPASNGAASLSILTPLLGFACILSMLL